MFDIAIIGGGPAGATLARLIGEQYKVILIDKKQLSPWSDCASKCCGGLLAPDAQKMLAKMGLGLPHHSLPVTQNIRFNRTDLPTEIFN